MGNIKIYIRFENNDEFQKAKDNLKQLGADVSNFICCHGKGWVHIEEGKMKVIPEIHFTKNSAIEHAKRNSLQYVVYTIYNFPQEIIENHKRQNVLRLITEPLVTQKEYRKTIEVLNEVFDHYSNYGTDEDKLKLSSYANVIKDLKTYIKKFPYG